MTSLGAERERPSITVGEVAELVGGRLVGSEAGRVTDVKPVDEAGPNEIAFLTAKRYVRYVESSDAGAYLVTSELEEHVREGVPCIVLDDVYPALRKLLERLHPTEVVPARVHPTAVIGAGATLGRDVDLGPYVVVDEGAKIGDGCRIGAHCVIGPGAVLGVDCHLYPHVVVYHGCELGDRVIVHSGARIGADGFGYTLTEGAHRKIPQVGRAIVGDDAEIGANSTIDRGSLGDTTIGDGVKIDNLVQVAHNVRIGERSLLAALVGVAGSTRVGKGVWMGGQVGVINHLEVGDGARLAVATKVMRDVPPGEVVSGSPARPHREQMRQQAHQARLPKLLDRVSALEDEVRRLRGEGSPPDDA